MPHYQRYHRTDHWARLRHRDNRSGDIIEWCVLLFIVVLLCQKSHGDLPHESGTEVNEPFPKSKCEALLSGCKCDDYEIITGLYCKNVTDFGTFTRTLENGSLFEVNTTYEITLVNTRVLPREFLKGLIVFRLYVDGPETQGLEEGAFDGVIRLRRFHVRLSSITKVPNFGIIRDSLRNLMIENSLLTSLEGNSLRDLPLVETVSFVNNSISYVDPDAFQGTENIIIFDISYNLLTSLPPGLFDTWGNVKKIVLAHNHLVHVNQLFAVVRPTFIYLDYNNLTDLDSVLHPNMTTLETLQLSYNPFERVSVDSFNGKLENARFLYLDHCLIREFDVDHYEGLSILATLDLSYNLIEEVTNQTVTFGYNVELDFVGNQIREFNAELPYNVKRVFLNKNLLTSLARTLPFSQMAEVSMADNRIRSLGPEDFRGVHGVQMLDLQGNVIETVLRFTFTNIRKDLIYLDLSRNRIRTLNGCVRYLSLLTSLNLTDNRIQVFEEGEFTGLNELTELYLQGNRISTIGTELQRLDQLQYLVISNNRIRTLKREQFPETLKYIYLAGNPFKCDCKLLPFLLQLNSSKIPSTDVPLCTASNETAINSTPPARCPSECRCDCTQRGHQHFVSVDCSSRGLEHLPTLFQIANASSATVENSTTMEIYLPRQMKESVIFSEISPFVIEDMIGGLDLSNNSLQTLEKGRFPDGLKDLRLSDNRLRQPPTALLYSLSDLSTVTLANNPWTCDCGTLGFKKWILSKSDIVIDANRTRCGPGDPESPNLEDRVIWSLTDLDLCPADIGFYISLAFGILCFCLAIAAAKIAWTRYEMNIKVWLYSHGVTWVKERDIDRDKQFDAFLSFSHKDENFVIKELINVIEEKQPNIRLCIHYKHFRAGDFIHENILTAVQNSKRTVLILSRNFLESEWCMMEFRAAHVQALKDRVNRIIVIKLGDIPKDIDPSIQLYLDSTTYLTWGEKYFWNNLLYTLPTSSKSQITTVRPSVDRTDALFLGTEMEFKT
ncbi:protein toll [Nephila pilipes]|uniref:Protein toll n=1 Tax=Nephila pilipes TaxID=299642 RepID=A0A8X6PIG7_NEPPI|nr:protein toll [Nephila pilipes]